MNLCSYSSGFCKVILWFLKKIKPATCIWDVKLAWIFIGSYFCYLLRLPVLLIIWLTGNSWLARIRRFVQLANGRGSWMCVFKKFSRSTWRQNNDVWGCKTWIHLLLYVGVDAIAWGLRSLFVSLVVLKSVGALKKYLLIICGNVFWQSAGWRDKAQDMATLNEANSIENNVNTSSGGSNEVNRRQCLLFVRLLSLLFDHQPFIHILKSTCLYFYQLTLWSLITTLYLFLWEMEYISQAKETI